MTKGKFITLEGGEGVGKSTNLFFIKKLLMDSGLEITITREPGGTTFAEKIRQLLLENTEELILEQTELLLMFAARAQHLHHVIHPALSQGHWVLCDRFTDATYAYQGGGRKMDKIMIEWLEDKVQGNLRPDLTLLLDAPVAIGLDRAAKRGKPDRFESERSEFFDRVRTAYLQQAKKHPGRIVIVNAAQPLESVQSEIEKIIQQFLNRHG